MQYFANLPIDRDVDAGAWAREREREGWHGVCASDHLWLGPLSYPHVWVTLTHMACATERIALTSSWLSRSAPESTGAARRTPWRAVDAARKDPS